ncbi:Leucine-rich repeat and guanylate kinase domain-containing protein [Lonchura striata]|uniref:Leucine-rich repeat and guanylate kinase domain-containing protein n=1 Tax=Lonchura striata TaxID=40157 RepID=A0A218VAS1_9PASE|nr:Leucine-rich repeat and guanylate kinase domain-containing protein [Lonchura striata domestica]
MERAHLEGVLDEDTTAEGLHTFGRSALGTEYVYLHLSLPGRGLRDISILSGYIHLQKMELSSNKINDLSCISHMPYLVELDVSKNQLTTYFDFKPPKNLKSFNQIEKVDGLKGLKSLRRVDLSNNKIKSLQGLEGHDLLEVINLENNQVAEVSELKWIKDLPLLRDVNLLKNPLQVAAVNAEDPPPEVVAAHDHRIQLLCHARQPQGLLDSTLPGFGDPYPMLVLLGPVAGGRRQLALKICRKFKNFFRFGPCHTTRTAYFGEENRFDYYFISQEEFGKMVEAGKFLATYKYGGHSYGLARDTVESIAREGLATCVHLEIEGVRSLKNTYFQPRYVLLVPRDKWKYGERLRRTGLFSRTEIAEALARVDTYLQINQDFPGYFHALINTDELEEAFTELTHLVKVYLGLEPPDSLDLQGTKGRADGVSNSPENGFGLWMVSWLFFWAQTEFPDSSEDGFELRWNFWTPLRMILGSDGVS